MGVSLWSSLGLVPLPRAFSYRPGILEGAQV